MAVSGVSVTYGRAARSSTACAESFCPSVAEYSEYPVSPSNR